MTTRQDSKCEDLHCYPSKAAAVAAAERKTQETELKHLGYPCECGAYHVERIDPIPPTPNQRAIAELSEALGHDNKALNLVLMLRKQEMDKYRRAHVPKRRAIGVFRKACG